MMEQEILALFEKVLSRKVGFNDELIESDILDSILAVDLVLEVQDIYGCMIPNRSRYRSEDPGGFGSLH